MERGLTIFPDGSWKWSPPPGFEFSPYKKLTKPRRERLEAYVRDLLQARFDGSEEPPYDPGEIWR